jgi:hypothetical protein
MNFILIFLNYGVICKACSTIFTKTHHNKYSFGNIMNILSFLTFCLKIILLKVQKIKKTLNFFHIKELPSFVRGKNKVSMFIDLNEVKMA